MLLNFLIFLIKFFFKAIAANLVISNYFLSGQPCTVPDEESICRVEGRHLCRRWRSDPACRVCSSRPDAGGIRPDDVHDAPAAVAPLHVSSGAALSDAALRHQPVWLHRRRRPHPRLVWPAGPRHLQVLLSWRPSRHSGKDSRRWPHGSNGARHARMLPVLRRRPLYHRWLPTRLLHRQCAGIQQSSVYWWWWTEGATRRRASIQSHQDVRLCQPSHLWVPPNDNPVDLIGRRATRIDGTSIDLLDGAGDMRGKWQTSWHCIRGVTSVLPSGVKCWTWNEVI